MFLGRSQQISQTVAEDDVCSTSPLNLGLAGVSWYESAENKHYYNYYNYIM